jgi:hypothetical protein
MLGPEKEKMLVANLDSALNKWIDEVPAHRKSVEPMAFTLPIRTLFQSNGIQIAKIRHSRDNQDIFMPASTICRSLSTDRLLLLPSGHHFLQPDSLPWSFVPTLLGYVAS